MKRLFICVVGLVIAVTAWSIRKGHDVDDSGA